MEIAAALEQALTQRARTGSRGRAAARRLAHGDGWSVDDVVCTSGPRDRPFEEVHGAVRIAIVAAGSFQYHSSAGGALMTPGSLLLGNAGHRFECGHAHGAGDRCVSFGYSPQYFERLVSDVGLPRSGPAFRVASLPAVQPLSPIVARSYAGLTAESPVAWEELGVLLAVRVVQVAAGLAVAPDPPSDAVARISRTVRHIERNADAALTLDSLARLSGLTPFHFLRTFTRVTRVTPHRYLRRVRLREAGRRLAAEQGKVVDIALDCGFGDVSNFNHAFLAEFGLSPRAFRQGPLG